MKATLKMTVGASVALMLLWALPVSAQTQKSQVQEVQPPAAPSSVPASEARPPVIEQENKPVAGQPSGTQQASPSEQPASQATPPEVKAQDGKSQDGKAKQ